MKNIKNGKSGFQCVLLCILLFALVIGCLAVLPTTVSAADPGTTMSSAIDIDFGSVYTKTWTKDTDHLNHYSKITVNEQGIICIKATKPFDDEGEYGRLNIVLYDEDGESFWGENTRQSVSDARDYYRMKVGLAPGVYYLTIQPGFTVSSGTIETEYSITFEANAFCEIEPNGDGSSATPVVLDEKYIGYFGSDDPNYDEYEYFKFPVVAGCEYRIYGYNTGKLLDSSTLVYLNTPDGESTRIIFRWRDQIDNDGAGYADIKSSTSGTAYLYFWNYSGPQIEYSFRVVSRTCMKNGHSCDSYITEKAATCTEAGLQSGFCNLCGKNQTWEVPALGHDVVIKKARAATCDKDGVTEGRYCARCDAVLVQQEVIVAPGHDFVDGSCTVCDAQSVAIKTQPKTGYAKKGENVKVSVKAVGDGLSYKWYIKNAGAEKYSKSSVTSATYSAKMSDSVKGRRVYCVVTDAYGNSVQTKTVILRESVSIVTQPKNTYTKSGSTAKVKMEASGDELTYEWYIKNAGSKKYSKSSVTSASYSCKMNEKSKDRYVYCVVTDKYGNTEKSKTVVLRMAATITTQPKNVKVAEGKTAKVTVEAVGDELTYQWFIKNEGASKFSKSSITKATYSVKMSEKVDGRQVYCVVTDKYGKTVTSNTITLKMK